MKRIWVVIVNIIIMISMVTFVVVYSNFEAEGSTRTQIEHFENTTITMEHVTENYLEGEQRICDVWAHYINSEDLTIDEAVNSYGSIEEQKLKSREVIKGLSLYCSFNLLKTI